MLALMLMPSKKIHMDNIITWKTVIVNFIVTVLKILMHSIFKLGLIFQLKVHERGTFTSLRSRRFEVVGTRKNGSRVSLAGARSLFRPLLPSAC